MSHYSYWTISVAEMVQKRRNNQKSVMIKTLSSFTDFDRSATRYLYHVLYVFYHDVNDLLSSACSVVVEHLHVVWKLYYTKAESSFPATASADPLIGGVILPDNSGNLAFPTWKWGSRKSCKPTCLFLAGRGWILLKLISLCPLAITPMTHPCHTILCLLPF